MTSKRKRLWTARYKNTYCAIASKYIKTRITVTPITCMNLVPDVNVRKLWKSIRAKCFRAIRPLKINSDSYLLLARAQTDMKSEPVSTKASRRSLEMVRVSETNYQVQYHMLALRDDYPRNEIVSKIMQWPNPFAEDALNDA